MEKAAISADYTASRYMRLPPPLVLRVVELTLDETVYPVIGCFSVGALGDIPHEDFVTTFPRLQRIVMPEALGTGMGLRFPQQIPFHIYSCLRNRNGPNQMPMADMTEAVRADLSGGEFETLFNLTEQIVLEAELEIVSTYRYKISVSECLEWPLRSESKVLYNQEFNGVSHSSSSSSFLFLECLRSLLTCGNL